MGDCKKSYQISTKYKIIQTIINVQIINNLNVKNLYFLNDLTNLKVKSSYAIRTVW